MSGDNNGSMDVFVKTLSTGAIQRITVGATYSTQVDRYRVAWSPDGTQIAFTTEASDLTPGDTNGSMDVFVETLATGAIQRITVDSTGTQANDHSYEPVWSPDGTRIAFTSWASDLVADDTNDTLDVFVKTLR